MPDPMVYLGRCQRCGSVIAMVVDLADSADYVAKSVAEFIKDGLTIDRVTLDVARKISMFCDCKKVAEQAELPLQEAREAREAS